MNNIFKDSFLWEKKFKVTSRYGTYVGQLLLLQALLFMQGYPYSNTVNGKLCTFDEK